MRELDKRGHRFVRYADNCNIYVSSERAGQSRDSEHRPLHRKTSAAQGDCGEELRVSTEHRHFLGFSLRCEPLDGSVEVALSQKPRNQMRERIRS